METNEIRTIKFRAWTGKQMLFKELDDKNWYDSYLIEGKLMCAASTNDCRRFKVMQFTGLKDKNGKEIYEGDILQKKDVRFIVGYGDNDENRGWGFNLNSIRSRKGYHLSTDVSKMEVIGNIYENPELLQEEKCHQ